MGYHLISVEPLTRLTGLDGPVIRLLTGIFTGEWNDCGTLFLFTFYKKLGLVPDKFKIISQTCIQYIVIACKWN